MNVYTILANDNLKVFVDGELKEEWKPDQNQKHIVTGACHIGDRRDNAGE